MGIDTAFFNVEITKNPILIHDKLGNPVRTLPASRLYKCYNITFMINYNKKTQTNLPGVSKALVEELILVRLAALPYGELNPNRFKFLNLFVG